MLANLDTLLNAAEKSNAESVKSILNTQLLCKDEAQSPIYQILINEKIRSSSHLCPIVQFLLKVYS